MTTDCGPANTECETTSCDGAGECATSYQPTTTTCNAELCQSCPGNSGICPTEDLCQPAVCRTPGFWGTHAGTEKPQSSDITFAVIQLGGGSLEICGETLTDTDLNHNHSAEEALCVSIKAEPRLQLARQLTAAALNCIVSGNPGPANCVGVDLYQDLFTKCNAACAANVSEAFGACIAVIDCLNNGGHPGLDALGGFLCASGTCSDNGALCTPTRRGNCANPETATCNPSANCHSEPLPGPFEPPGPAGSSKKCSAAIGNTCEIFDASCP